MAVVLCFFKPREKRERLEGETVGDGFEQQVAMEGGCYGGLRLL